MVQKNKTRNAMACLPVCLVALHEGDVVRKVVSALDWGRALLAEVRRDNRGKFSSDIQNINDTIIM